MGRHAKMTGRRARRFMADQRGVSAIEFSLFAAILLPVLLVGADVGFAIHQRMIMDGILRIGAQEAMRFQPDVAPDERGDSIAQALRLAAGSNATGGMENLTVAVSGPLCYCPETPGAEVSCDTPCAGGAPHRFFQLDAAMPYRSRFVGDLSAIGLADLRSRLRVDIYSQAAP